MRICHLTTVHPAKDTRIFYRMAQCLARRGLSVVLIAPESFEDSLVEASLWNSHVGQTSWRFNRMLIALRAALHEQADIYHFHDPELIPVGLALKLLKPSAAVIYDVHEDYPAMMRVKHWIPRLFRPLIAGAVYLVHACAGKFLDGIVTADPYVQNDFLRVAQKKTLVFYNFPELSLFQSSCDTALDVQADLVYVGGISERAGTFVLLDALKLLAQQGIYPTVRLAGYTDGQAGWAAVHDGICQRGLEKQIEYVGRIPSWQVPAWIRSGRIGLVTLQPIAKFLKNIPSKQFEYWACGLPVIAGDLPPIRRFVSHSENGLLFQATSAPDLAQAIRKLLEQPAKCKAMGSHGQQQVQDSWNNESQVNELVKFYEYIRKN